MLAHLVLRCRAAWGRWRRRVRAASSDAVGRRGERAAERLLRAEGYRILAKRVRTRGGEVDLVAIDGDTLALVEVKATRSLCAADPSRRVDARKRRRLAAAWAALARRPDIARRPRRLDVVSVVFEGRQAVARLHRGFARLDERRGDVD